MSRLREDVKIITASSYPTTGGELQGYLHVGVGGLPELKTDGGSPWNFAYTPAAFPAAWTLRAIGEPGVLLSAWWAIQGIQEELRKAERGAADDDKERARESEGENRIAREIDERREDEKVG